EGGGDHLAHGLLERLGDVVDVVGHPAQQLAAGLAVEVAQRQTVDLVLDVGTKPPDGPLDDVGDPEPLEPAGEGGHAVHADDESQDLADGGEVDPPAGDDVHRLQHPGEGVLPLGPQSLDDGLFGDPGRELGADEAAEDLVGRPAEHLGGEHGQHDADDRQHQHGDDLDAVGAQQAEEALRRALEVHRLLADYPAHHRPVTGPGDDALGFFDPAIGHATPSSDPSWDQTISW